MTEKFIKQILDMLDNVHEKLLSLPDDMLLRIDPRDNVSVDNGCEFIKRYNNELNKFSIISTSLKKQIEQHFSINSETEEIETSRKERSSRERIIAELDKTEPHTLDEEFTYKRPYGFVLGDAAYKGIKTWKSLYLNVLSELSKLNPTKFESLPNIEQFVSNRGNPQFSIDINDIRVASKVENHDFYTEVNLSANSFRNLIKQLFAYFEVPKNDIRIYLRKDLDADEKY